MSTNVLVTGVTGFVGSEVIKQLSRAGFDVTGVSRRKLDGPFRVLQISSLSCMSECLELIRSVDVVVHCAARAHIMKDEVTDPLAEYREVNVEGTRRLARHAAKAGAKRFIFISSVKVNGEGTALGNPYHADDKPAPNDPYGISKMEAEQVLWEVSRDTNMEIVIIRPPLVYGPGVKGNFAKLIRLVGKEFPLPLGSIHNKRSLVALDNLVDLVMTCVDHPAAANQVFLAGDGQDISTTELLRGLGKAMGKPVRLIPVPASMLILSASLLGKKAAAQRLLGSLQVDISKSRHVLGWEPPISVDEGLRRCFVPEKKN